MCKLPKATSTGWSTAKSSGTRIGRQASHAETKVETKEKELTNGLMISKRNQEAIPDYDERRCQNNSAIQTQTQLLKIKAIFLTTTFK